MIPFPIRPQSGWYASRSFQKVALVLLVAVLLIEGVVAIAFRENDFVFHLDFGRTFLEGNAYALTITPYPMGRLVFNAALALLPYYVARTLCYIAAVVALASSFYLWNQRANVRRPVPKAIAFAAGVFTLGILYPYVLRDLDDCGLQILLLFFLTAAMAAMAKQRSFAAGTWLAVAASYKLMPILFLPLLVWKQQWRGAVGMGIALAIINLAIPSLFLGWSETVAANRRWWTQMKQCAQVQDPCENGVEPPRHQNQSLQMAIARYVQTYPPGHPLHLDHSLFAQFGNLDKTAASHATKGTLLVLAGLLAYRLRRRWGEGPRQADITHEWAGVMILCALLSALCWLQHLVLVVPAVFLIVRSELERHSREGVFWNPRTMALAIVGFIVLFLQRDVVQRELSVLLLSYKIDTFACLVVLLVVLAHSPSVRAAEADVRPDVQVAKKAA